MNLGKALELAAARSPTTTAVVIDDERLTFAGLHERVVGRSRMLMGWGVRPGEHVGLVSENSTAFIESLFALATIGAVVVPINPQLAPAEVARMVEHAELVALICPDFAGADDSEEQELDLLVAAVAASAGTRLRGVLTDRDGGGSGIVGSRALAERARRVSRADVAEVLRGVSPLDPAIMLFTSGTTAHPKGALHTHSSALQTSVARLTERLAPGVGQRHWCPAPLFHAAALGVLIGTVCLERTFLSTTRFDPGSALQRISTDAVDCAWIMFPAFVQAMATCPALESVDTSSVQLAAMVLDPAAMRMTEDVFPNAVVVSGYGLTEVFGIVTMPSYDESRERRTEACGRPFAGLEVRAIDLESGRSVYAPEPGELVFRGYSLCTGYFRDPEATDACVDDDGYFHTGDLGTVDEDGTVLFLGRLKDTLKVGGENVAAMEVEAVLLAHPDVVAAAVIGIPHDRLGEVPAAYLELAPNADTSADRFVDHCSASLARFKVPRTVWLVEPGSWPMSATKIDKDKLRRRAPQSSE